MKKRIVACILAAMVGMSGSASAFAQNTSAVLTGTVQIGTNTEQTLDTPELKDCTARGQQITIEWTKVTNADGYYVYRKTADGEYHYLDFVDDADQTFYHDTDVKSGVAYTYTVRAYARNGYGTSKYNQTGLTATAYYLKAPKMEDAFITAKGEVTVHWVQVSDATRYYVYRKTGKNGKWERIGQKAASSKSKTLSLKDKNAENPEKYYYTVRACQEVKNGDGTEKYYSIYDETGIGATPYQPAEPSVKAAGIKKIRISWEAVTGAQGYYVYRRKAGKSSWGKSLAKTSKLSWKDDSATPGQLYEYAIRAYTTENQSAYAISPKVATYTPEKTTIRKASASGSHIRVYWKAVTGADGYDVYRKTSSDKRYQMITGLKRATGSSYLDTTAKKNIRYTYKVQAYTLENGKKHYGAMSGTVSANNGVLPKVSGQSVYVGATAKMKVKNNKKAVSWSSMDRSVATISSKGVVRGVKAGKAKICARIDGVNYYCTVKVKPAMTTSVPSEITIRSTKTIPITLHLPGGKINYKLDNGNATARFGSWKKHTINLYVTPKHKGTVHLTISNTKNKERIKITIHCK